MVFNLSTLIVVRNFQGTLLYPYAHEFPPLADAVYILWLRRVRIRY